MIDKYLGTQKEILLKDFLTAKAEISQWTKSNSEISKRSVPKTSLSKSQRTGLRKFYELFYELTSKKKEFSSSLNNITKEISLELPDNQDRSPRNVLRILDKINWTGPKIRVKEIPKVDWNKHLYSFFYDKEENFKKHVDSLDQKIEQAERLQRSMISSSGMWSGYRRQQAEQANAKKLVDSLKNNSSSEVEYQVGAKLLEWMNQS